MKTSKIVLLLTTAFILCFSSCQNDLVPVPDNDVYQYSDGDDLLKKGKISRTVIFEGRYDTYPEIINQTEEGVLTVLIPSEGTANVLGESTWFSESLVHAYDETGPWVQTGDMVFEETATGDQLIGYFEGTSQPNPPLNPFMGSGVYVIKKGTGKYRGVKGSGTYAYAVIVNDEGVLVGDLTFTGTLKIPGRKRHGKHGR